MTPSQIEWYTFILPFILTPIAVIAFIFFWYVWPAWIGSFEENKDISAEDQ